MSGPNTGGRSLAPDALEARSVQDWQLLDEDFRDKLRELISLFGMEPLKKKVKEVGGL